MRFILREKGVAPEMAPTVIEATDVEEATKVAEERARLRFTSNYQRFEPRGEISVLTALVLHGVDGAGREFELEAVLSEGPVADPP